MTEASSERFVTRSISVALGLYSLSLLVSIAGMEILSSLIAVLVLFLCVQSKEARQQFRFRPLFEGMLVLFVAVVALGAFLKNPTSRDPVHMIGAARWALLFLFICMALRVTWPKSFDRAFTFLAAIAGVISVYAIFQFFTGIDLIRPAKKVADAAIVAQPKFHRAGGVFGAVMTYAHSTGVFFFALLGYALTCWNRFSQKTRFFWVTVLILVLGGIVATQTRGVWLGVVAGMCCAFFLTSRKAFFRFVLAMPAMVAILFALSEHLRQRFLTIFDPSFRSNMERVDMWVAHFHIFLDNLFIGVGYRANGDIVGDYFQKLGIQDGFVSHAHSNWLDMLAGVGLLGFLSWALFLGMATFWAYRLWKSDTTSIQGRALALGFLSGHVFFQVAGFTQSNFFDAEVCHIFLFFVALITIAFEKEEGSPSQAIIGQGHSLDSKR